MQFHLDEVSLVAAKGAHGVLLLDRAGWHTTGNLIARRTSRKPRLRHLRGHLRGRLRGLAWPARHHHLNRPARLGSHRSKMKPVGITARRDYDAARLRGLARRRRALRRGVVCWHWRRSMTAARARRRPASAGRVADDRGLDAEVQRLKPRVAGGTAKRQAILAS
jgi:IS5 family transposase